MFSFVFKILFSFYPCDILKVICNLFLFKILFYFSSQIFYKKIPTFEKKFFFFPCSLFF
ncbi:conserved domain protein [Peptoniphilus sp. oral taxon 375 str. F0436]|nr:conserved domain protein [Peptoniphilus sp. oral taxon 375 str. F0436]